MIRITVAQHSRHEIHLRIDGELAGGDVEVLQRVGDQAWRAADRLVLDLVDLRGIDAAGLTLLAAWDGPRLRLTRVPAYIATLLAQHRDAGSHRSTHPDTEGIDP